MTREPQALALVPCLCAEPTDEGSKALQVAVPTATLEGSVWYRDVGGDCLSEGCAHTFDEGPLLP